MSRQAFRGASCRQAFGGAFGRLCVMVGFQVLLCIYREILRMCINMRLVLVARSVGSGDSDVDGAMAMVMALALATLPRC
jgi:hypothetical protein